MPSGLDAASNLASGASPFSLSLVSRPSVLLALAAEDASDALDETKGTAGQSVQERAQALGAPAPLGRRRRTSGLVWQEEVYASARDGKHADERARVVGTPSANDANSEDGRASQSEENRRDASKFSPLPYTGASRVSLQKADSADDDAGTTNVEKLLRNVGRLNSELAADVQENQILTTQIVGSTVLALKAKSLQLGGLEKAVGVLKSNVRVGQWRVSEFLDLIRAKASERQALFRERLSNIRDRINELSGSIILQTMAGLRGAVEDLKNEADAMLLGEKYSSRMKQVELQLLGNAMKLDELRGTLKQARARIDTWMSGAANVVQQMGRDATRLAQAGQEFFLNTAAAILRQKEEEFALFSSTPRVELTYGDMVVDQILRDFASADVSVIDVSSWLQGISGKKPATVDKVAGTLLSKLRVADPSLNIRAVFCFIPPYPGVARLDSVRFHIVPDLHIVQTALSHLQKIDVPRSYALLSVDQVLIQSQIVAFDGTGKRAASAVFVQKPRGSHGDVVLSRVDTYGLAFRRNLTGPSGDVIHQALRATANTKVLLVYAGQRPATSSNGDASMRHHSMSYLTEAGSRAAEFARYQQQSLPELQQLSVRLRAELRFFTTIERNCKKAIVSADIPPDVQQALHLPPLSLGVYRIYHVNRTAVFAAFAEVPLPPLPLSSFFRSSVGMLRLDIARSSYGNRDFAVPPRAALAQALSILLSQQVDGDAAVTIRTQVTSDTRLSWIRSKKARASIHLQTSVTPPLYVSHYAIADIRNEYLTPQSILTAVADYVANKFLSQNFVRYRDKLEGRVLYIQISHQDQR
uniref:Uncharacterized protein n=1 Tax=Neospora caninum (strain Liverpool) TaxID=572307 RepID=F0JAY9_NEOCL|nr:hypothetical protein, conserved [Neospora caninum Liverpool]CEL71255.1 TPA: hypothetical protein, conserved [Neospora caninum Liverpool]